MTGGLLAALASAVGLAYVSAILPLVNAEVLAVSYAALLGSTPKGVLLAAAAVSVGQMMGKATIYWMARGAAVSVSEKRRRKIERWEARFARSPRAITLFVLASSAVSIPPFYATCILAGVFRTNFAAFFVAGFLGRLARFGAVAAFPGWVAGLLKG